jgi:dethiobiotin synthetase
MPCRAENIATLRQRLQAPLLGVVPWLATPDAPRIALQLPEDWH